MERILRDKEGEEPLSKNTTTSKKAQSIKQVWIFHTWPVSVPIGPIEKGAGSRPCGNINQLPTPSGGGEVGESALGIGFTCPSASCPDPDGYGHKVTMGSRAGWR